MTISAPVENKTEADKNEADDVSPVPKGKSPLHSASKENPPSLTQPSTANGLVEHGTSASFPVLPPPPPATHYVPMMMPVLVSQQSHPLNMTMKQHHPYLMMFPMPSYPLITPNSNSSNNSNTSTNFDCCGARWIDMQGLLMHYEMVHHGYEPPYPAPNNDSKHNNGSNTLIANGSDRDVADSLLEVAQKMEMLKDDPNHGNKASASTPNNSNVNSARTSSNAHPNPTLYGSSSFPYLMGSHLAALTANKSNFQLLVSILSSTLEQPLAAAASSSSTVTGQSAAAASVGKKALKIHQHEPNKKKNKPAKNTPSSDNTEREAKDTKVKKSNSSSAPASSCSSSLPAPLPSLASKKSTVTFSTICVAGRPAIIDRSSQHPYKCPIPGCRRAYKNPNGLKYHSRHAHLNIPVNSSLQKPGSKAADGKEPVTSSPLANTNSNPNSDSSTTIPNSFVDDAAIAALVAAEEEDERDDRPYACGVPGCDKRYKNANGLKYHTTHSHQPYKLNHRYDAGSGLAVLNDIPSNSHSSYNSNALGGGLRMQSFPKPLPNIATISTVGTNNNSKPSNPYGSNGNLIRSASTLIPSYNNHNNHGNNNNLGSNLSVSLIKQRPSDANGKDSISPNDDDDGDGSHAEFVSSSSREDSPHDR